VEKLCFGISRLHGGPRLEDAAQAFSMVMAEATGRAPDLLVTDHYEELLSGVLAGRCHFAWMPPLTLARAIHGGGVLACISQRRGRLVYRSAFVVRFDSPYTDLPSLRGARAAWTNASSAGGYIIPRAMLAEHGVHPGTLGSETFFGSVADACAAVRSREADVATCYVSNDAAADLLVAQHEIARTLGVGAGTELRVVGVTPLIPPDGFVISGLVEPVFRARLRTSLAEVHRLEGGIEALAQLAQAERLVQPTLESMRLLTQLSAMASGV
jgi:ABC-type phosphate/phosphonate transport system substrate-binding protein